MTDYFMHVCSRWEKDTRRILRREQDIQRIVNSHFEPEESLRLGQPVFSITTSNEAPLLTLDDFAKRIGLSPEKVRRLLQAK